MSLRAYSHHLTIRARIIILICITVLGSGLTLSYVGMKQYQETILSQSINHMITIRESRIHDIREHLMQEVVNIDMLSSQPNIKKSLLAYDHHDFGPDTTSRSYQKADAMIGAYFSFFRQKSKYYDLFLISTDGDVFYSDAKESDLGTNLMAGRYRTTQLADVFRRAKFLIQPQISTIQYYAPSNADAIFIAAPVFDDGKVIGFVALQLNLTELNNVITTLTGLMHTGEVVAATAIGDDAYLAVPLRNNHRLKSKKIPLHSDWAKPLQTALQGTMGSGAALDYRGVAVEAVWGYLPELKLGIVIKIDRSELLKPVERLQQELILTTAVILSLIILMGIVFARTITSPIEKLKKSVSRYTQGGFTERSSIHGSNEIGQLAKEFNGMADSIGHYHAEVQQKNRELKTYSDGLEQRVDDRTATLSAANEEIKSFAYIVSHDLRSPLVNMKGFTGELAYALKEISAKISSIQSALNERDRKEIQQLLDEDIPESMQFISGSVDKMDHMLSAILRLSRLGRRELSMEPIDLVALCHDILSSLAYQIDQAGAKATVGDLPVIKNDRMVMEQIMGNLIGNAVKYLDPERPGQIDISSAVSDTSISIAVRDNGRGILPQEKEKVFQIFRRGIHQDVAGEGMGLPYVQTLVRAQGGSISFEPAPVHGIIFTISLPLQGCRG